VRRNTLKVIVGEGRKREVRVLVESTGMEVLSLARIRIGSLTLGKLPVGFYKELGDKEMELIFKK
jgi:23S rRNA pseudouridine2605 synthase